MVNAEVLGSHVDERLDKLGLCFVRQVDNLLEERLDLLACGHMPLV